MQAQAYNNKVCYSVSYVLGAIRVLHEVWFIIIHVCQSIVRSFDVCVIFVAKKGVAETHACASETP